MALAEVRYTEVLWGGGALVGLASLVDGARGRAAGERERMLLVEGEAGEDGGRVGGVGVGLVVVAVARGEGCGDGGGGDGLAAGEGEVEGHVDVECALALADVGVEGVVAAGEGRGVADVGGAVAVDGGVAVARGRAVVVCDQGARRGRDVGDVLRERHRGRL